LRRKRVKPGEEKGNVQFCRPQETAASLVVKRKVLHFPCACGRKGKGKRSFRPFGSKRGRGISVFISTAKQCRGVRNRREGERNGGEVSRGVHKNKGHGGGGHSVRLETVAGEHRQHPPIRKGQSNRKKTLSFRPRRQKKAQKNPS